MVEVEHHDGKGTAFSAGGVEFAIKKLLHVAAVVKAGERVADSLQAETFTQGKIRNRNCDVFCHDGSKLTATSKVNGVSVWIGSGGQEIVILDGQCSDGFAVSDERNADRSAFP
jgi:hypothetical protein